MKRCLLLLSLTFLVFSCFAQRNPNRGNERHPEHHQSAEVHQYMYAASPYQVEVMMNYLKGISFDSDRLKAAVMCVTICPIAVNDLIPIINLFSFDDKKAEVLKAAYCLCPDKHHYYRAVEQLTFRSNQDAVYDYIDSLGY